MNYTIPINIKEEKPSQTKAFKSLLRCQLLLSVPRAPLPLSTAAERALEGWTVGCASVLTIRSLALTHPWRVV